MGGETPISYLAISRYAADHAIGDDDIHIFRAFVTAVDAEWLVHVAEETKRKEQK